MYTYTIHTFYRYTYIATFYIKYFYAIVGKNNFNHFWNLFYCQRIIILQLRLPIKLRYIRLLLLGIKVNKFLKMC